jgi:hypothetical protein
MKKQEKEEDNNNLLEEFRTTRMKKSLAIKKILKNSLNDENIALPYAFSHCRFSV